MKQSASNKFSFLLITLAFTSTYVLANNSQELSIVEQNSSNNLTPKPKDNGTERGTIGNATSLNPIKGGVEKVELNLTKLEDVGIDLKEALRALGGLHDDVSIQPVRIVTQPTIIGAGTIINLPVGTEPVGPPQPARKERVDSAIKRVKPIINLLKNNADNFANGQKRLDLPDDVLTKLEPTFKTWIELVNNITSKQLRLEQETLAPPYDNSAIASLTASMQEDLKSLDKTRLTIYKVIRKEEKRSKNR